MDSGIRDEQVRARAFEFLAQQTQLLGEVLPWSVLSRGFDFEGQRVPLIGPQGIFKPAALPEMPLSIATAPEVEGRPRPCSALSIPQPFDRNIFGIRPDLIIEVRKDVLAQTDGPMLRHALQEINGLGVATPRAAALRPRPAFLEIRYAAFRKAS
jgi:hypothetical protein